MEVDQGQSIYYTTIVDNGFINIMLNWSSRHGKHLSLVAVVVLSQTY